MRHEVEHLIGLHVGVPGRVTRIDGDELVVSVGDIEVSRAPPEKWRQWLASMGLVKITLPEVGT